MPDNMKFRLFATYFSFNRKKNSSNNRAFGVEFFHLNITWIKKNGIVRVAKYPLLLWYIILGESDEWIYERACFITIGNKDSTL
jgi:hypothetical protein